MLALGACRDDRPPAPSEEQSAQLNDAESMLDAEAARQSANAANAAANSSH